MRKSPDEASTTVKTFLSTPVIQIMPSLKSGLWSAAGALYCRPAGLAEHFNWPEATSPLQKEKALPHGSAFLLM